MCVRGVAVRLAARTAAGGGGGGGDKGRQRACGGGGGARSGQRVEQQCQGVRSNRWWGGRCPKWGGGGRGVCGEQGRRGGSGRGGHTHTTRTSQLRMRSGCWPAYPEQNWRKKAECPTTTNTRSGRTSSQRLNSPMRRCVCEGGCVCGGGGAGAGRHGAEGGRGGKRQVSGAVIAWRERGKGGAHRSTASPRLPAPPRAPPRSPCPHGHPSAA